MNLGGLACRGEPVDVSLDDERLQEHGDDERSEVHKGETDYTSRWLATTRVMISSSPTAGR